LSLASHTSLVSPQEVPSEIRVLLSSINDEKFYGRVECDYCMEHKSLGMWTYGISVTMETGEPVRVYILQDGENLEIDTVETTTCTYEFDYPEPVTNPRPWGIE